jgi:hypothetical protein
MIINRARAEELIREETAQAESGVGDGSSMER